MAQPSAEGENEGAARAPANASSFEEWLFALVPPEHSGPCGGPPAESQGARQRRVQWTSRMESFAGWRRM